MSRVSYPDPDRVRRRVYVLPAPLLAEVRGFQRAEAYPSEVAAVRRLLEIALDRRGGRR